MRRGGNEIKARYLHSGHFFEISNFFGFGLGAGFASTLAAGRGCSAKLLHVRFPHWSTPAVVPRGQVTTPPGENPLLGGVCPPADWHTVRPSPLVVGNEPSAHCASAAHVAASRTMTAAGIRMAEPRSELSASPSCCQHARVRRVPNRAIPSRLRDIFAAFIVVFLRPTILSVVGTPAFQE